jgi:hypothetical protein
MPGDEFRQLGQGSLGNPAGCLKGQRLGAEAN